MTDIRPVTDGVWHMLNDMSDPRHGTYNGYSNCGCRCPRCKKANADRSLRAKEDRRTRGTVPRKVHGTENGYGNYRCTCKRCRKAWSDATGRRAKAARQRANASASDA